MGNFGTPGLRMKNNLNQSNQNSSDCIVRLYSDFLKIVRSVKECNFNERWESKYLFYRAYHFLICNKTPDGIGLTALSADTDSYMPPLNRLFTAKLN